MQKINYLHDMASNSKRISQARGLFPLLYMLSITFCAHKNKIAVSTSRIQKLLSLNAGFETLKLQWKIAVESGVEKEMYSHNY